MWRSVMLVGAVLTGCTVGPDYKGPTSEGVPTEFDASVAGVLDGVKSPAEEPVDLAAWWKSFDDPMLTRLIERAAAENLDVAQATARLRESRAILGLTRTLDLPTVDAAGGYRRQRGSENGVFPGGQDEDYHAVGFDMVWELDVFGRNRRAVEAAEAEVGAATASLRGVQVTLAAEVGRTYFELRSAQERLAIARGNAEIQRQSLELARARYEAGLTSELDVAGARVLLSETQAVIPRFEAEAASAAHRLGVLVGLEPRALVAELAEARPLPERTSGVPIGLPSELLLRRPDLKEAERRLAGSTARVGVATAELFPRVQLTGEVGLESLSAEELFNASSRFYGVGPVVRWRVFDFGRIRRDIEAAEARTDEAAAAYQQAVLVALEEVYNALVREAAETARVEQLREAQSAGRRSVEIATELYSRGLSDQIRVLDAQRQLFIVEESLADAKRSAAVQRVALYKALGGGWEQR
jgi:NodT family efflux transporter outer membrane factor (OMF) lipoprotein